MLGFEEGGEGESFLLGQLKIGHARRAEVLSDARWVLQELKQPRRLVAKSGAAEVGRQLAKGRVRREFSMTFGAADLGGQFATAFERIRFSGEKSFRAHPQQRHRDKGGEKFAVVKRGHGRF